ncbi:MAG: flagellin lysine-N-methylase [Alphaproteobacteria bacterium]|nr:flagellin lysine-N-methylase [Alphaproteobacteria bacterium]
MNPTRMHIKAVERFSCLGSECPDTCCKGWGMQLTAETVAKYTSEAPELLAAVSSGESEFIMRRDPATDYCVKFEGGLCSIHRDYGEDFLGDACHFYPRITRALGGTLLTSAALSCPEAARLMLYAEDGEEAFATSERRAVRTPYSLRNVLPEGLDADAALGIHQTFLAVAGDTQFSASYNLMRVSAIARAIEMQPANAWAEAVPLYRAMAESRIPAAEPQPVDIFNLLHALQGLVAASRNPRPALLARIAAMAQALGAQFAENGAIVLAEDAATYALRVLARIRAQGNRPEMQAVLRHYVQAQLSQALFPFAGFGGTLSERVTVIGVRLATVRLALATLGEAPDEAAVVEAIYTLSRFMDHLADPTLSLQIYRETGWVRESRLRALIGE